MDVLAEILTWSIDRPDWQRDALRRLVLGRELNEEDIDALSEICKSAHGLAAEQKVIPLAKDHLPVSGPHTGRVNIHSIHHQCGVNALAENQTLTFGPGLTVVYGDNAAGKSGYTRIFKSACRARGAEDILGNVLSGLAPPKPVVAIKYTVGDEPEKQWPDDGGHEFLARVSVFDRHSEAVYTTQKTDVAFRPFGLDLFDKLSKACAAVRLRLEREQRAMSASITQTLTMTLPENTAASKFVFRLSSLTKPEEVKILATLSEEETQRLELLEKQILDLQANDAVKTRQEIILRAGRLRSLAQHFAKVETALSQHTAESAFNAQKDLLAKQQHAIALRQTSFPPDLLPGAGSESWNQMWEAARKFSEDHAYPGLTFPVTDHARCVLCQQDLAQDAASRLNHFEEFIVSAAEKELRGARETYNRLHNDLRDLRPTDTTTEQTLKELRVESDSLAGEAVSALSISKQQRTAIMEALAGGSGLPANLVQSRSVTKKIEALVTQLDQRANSLQAGTTEAQKKTLSAELQELKARKLLGKHEQVIIDEIERKRKVAAYGLCLDDTRTQAITMKSTAVTKVAVTQQLKATFKDELKNLKFRHVEVELTEAGGESGSLYHKLILTRAPGVELPKVVSEGEARCLSIAAFFAELSTADDPSAILFDDPVSSFDYKWRESVAQRLVEEANTRQVIVFTHDIVFLLLLQQHADQLGVKRLDQHVRQLPMGAGVCEAELPWVALPVKKRIGFLKKTWQEADKLFRTGQQMAYDKEAAYSYGLLREAWERALEEILLGGIVERYRASVQTQQIEQLADITPEDCKAVEAGMTKCSKWLPGHDQAPAAKQDMPPPDELKADIDALELWVSQIKKRRQ